ncbi:MULTISPECIES: hypothetical protein [Paraburkholderia]
MQTVTHSLKPAHPDARGAHIYVPCSDFGHRAFLQSRSTVI